MTSISVYRCWSPGRRCASWINHWKVSRECSVAWPARHQSQLCRATVVNSQLTFSLPPYPLPPLSLSTFITHHKVDKQLKKSRRPAAATSAAAAAAAAAASSASYSAMSWSRVLAGKSESIARISLYALPVLIAFLCNARARLSAKPLDTPMRQREHCRNMESSGSGSCCQQHDRCLLAQLSDSTPCR